MVMQINIPRGEKLERCQWLYQIQLQSMTNIMKMYIVQDTMETATVLYKDIVYILHNQTKHFVIYSPSNSNERHIIL